MHFINVNSHLLTHFESIRMNLNDGDEQISVPALGTQTPFNLPVFRGFSF